MEVDLKKRMGDHTTHPFGMSDSAIGKGLTYGAETTANGWPDGRYRGAGAELKVHKAAEGAE